MSDRLPFGNNANDENKPKVDYRGRAAYVLAFSLGASIIMLSALAALDVFRSGELSAVTAGMLSSVFAGIIGAVATFMGGRSSSSQQDAKQGLEDFKNNVAALTPDDNTSQWGPLPGTPAAAPQPPEDFDAPANVNLPTSLPDSSVGLPTSLPETGGDLPNLPDMK